MERLTMRNSDGSASQPTHSSFFKVFNRLAEYEDTGLSPEEIEQMKRDLASAKSTIALCEEHLKQINYNEEIFLGKLKDLRRMAEEIVGVKKSEN